MDDETKSRLRRLQAEVRLKVGTRATQQKVLAWLVESVIESKADLIDSSREERVSPSASERKWLHDGMASSDATTTEEDVDNVLYG